MKKAGDFVLLEAGQKIRIIYSEKENSAVKCAIQNLAEDIKKCVTALWNREILPEGMLRRMDRR